MIKYCYFLYRGIMSYWRTMGTMWTSKSKYNSTFYSEINGDFSLFRIPNVKWSIVFQLVAAWKDSLVVHWVDVVMSKSIQSLNLYSSWKTKFITIIICFSIFRCESDYDCGNQEFCQDFKCQQACSECGTGAQCVRVSNHRAICECPKVISFNDAGEKKNSNKISIQS